MRWPDRAAVVGLPARLLPPIVDAACGDLDRPAEAELRADVVDHGITPLFDNETLERI